MGFLRNIREVTCVRTTLLIVGTGALGRGIEEAILLRVPHKAESANVSRPQLLSHIARKHLALVKGSCGTYQTSVHWARSDASERLWRILGTCCLVTSSCPLLTLITAKAEGRGESKGGRGRKRSWSSASVWTGGPYEERSENRFARYLILRGLHL